MKKTVGQLLLLAVILWGCSKGISPTDTAKVKEAFAKYPDGEGKSLFLEKCGKCHKYQLPEFRTADKWTGIMERMAKKAKLTDTQKAAVTEFVKSNAKAS
ncbi:hypothetical protein KTO58_26220 [Chitinophaga pendula]|uniref:hypothetical protein n=1 Tax=Chitinophaga TaxID=79328 RepID=UPI000BB01D6E|nr:MULTISPECIES: hypothetical protein [Chitinophaga]ASZ09938.1 hypothetical protein CK934_02550 [Chitinophaga sp. MD30]UCJ07122.1 hypothetical protein KTO58_26220 [Chitinophaga pendula]